MRKFIALLIGGLLACACSHPPEQNKLVLLVDAYQEGNTRVTGQVCYVTDECVLSGAECDGQTDTITISTSAPYIEVAIAPLHSISNIAGGKKIHLKQGAIFLLQANDTVRVSYQKEGYYTYKGRPSVPQAVIAQADSLSKLYLQSTELYLPLLVAYNSLCMQADKPNYQLPPNFVSPDSILAPYCKSIALANQRLDSLNRSGSLPPVFYRYYRYRLSWLAAMPSPMQVPVRVDPKYRQRIPPLLNDSLCRYISYWDYVAGTIDPLVTPVFGKRTPILEGTDIHLVTTDNRKIFDALAHYTDSVPPRTLNLMRYLCLDYMRMIGKEGYSEADHELYLKKYQTFSNDFLEQTPNTTKTGLDKLVGTPFRFFLYLIEFAAYTFIILFVYRRWLRKRMGLVTRRVYLLLGLVVAMLVPLFTIASQLRAIEKTAYWNSIVSPVSEALFCLYLLGCCVLLYEMARWLWQVEKMRRNSWRIHCKRYTMCVLMDMETEPTIFGRKIFVSWNDWWNPKDKLAKERIRDSEMYRIDHWHTFDSLLLSIVRIGCWGNPLLYCYNKELQKANDMAASNHAYSNRATMLYTATEEARELHSGLILGLAGSECTQKSNRLVWWFSNVKYQLLILLVVFIIVAILVELAGTISKLSATSFF